MRNVAFAVMVAGCGGGSSEVKVDAASDAAKSIDAAPLITGDIIGTWNRAPEQDQAIGFATVTFKGDGTFVEGTDTGTFTLPSAGRVKMTSSNNPLETDYIVGDGHLIITAFVAQGTVAGNVGTWLNTTTTNGSTGTFQMTTNADHSATYTIASTQGSIPIMGTWAATAPGFTFTSTSPAMTQKFEPIGTAIGYLYFVKAQ